MVDKLRPRLVVLITGIVLGSVIGAATNFIGNQICDDYFAIVLRASSRSMSLGRIATQGIVEGAIGGGIASIGIATMIHSHEQMRLALKTLASCVVLILTCWIIGGIIAISAQHGIPSLFDIVFPQSGLARSPVTFAWVGGSVWGLYMGTFLSLILGSFRFHKAAKASPWAPRGFPVSAMDVGTVDVQMPAEESVDAVRQMRERS